MTQNQNMIPKMLSVAQMDPLNQNLGDASARKEYYMESLKISTKVGQVTPESSIIQWRNTTRIAPNTSV